jgi:ABC-type cobalt transport system substrate-binding protein
LKRVIINEKYFENKNKKHNTKEIALDAKKKPYLQPFLLPASIELLSFSYVIDSCLHRAIISNVD